VKEVEGKFVVEEKKVLNNLKAFITICPMKSLFGSSTVCRMSGPSEKISVAEVKAVIAKMKTNKAADLSEVVLELLKASG